MPSNAQKTPLSRALNEFAQKKVLDALQQLGKELPCSVVSAQDGMVTVKFELDSAPFTLPQVTVPWMGAQYVRLPLQEGDAGYVSAADARLDGVSGVSDAVADLSPPANLTALVFTPISNAKWFSVDGNVLVLYGPHGVTVRNLDGSIHIDVTETDIQMHGDVTIHGNVTIDGNATITGDTSMGGGAKRVVLDGDPVVGGAVVASSTKTNAT